MDYKKLFKELPEDLECSSKCDEFKFLILYAYNAYFDANALNTEQLKDGICYDRTNKYNIDGVFINETLDEDTLEVLYSYYVEEGQEFDKDFALKIAKEIGCYISDVIDKQIMKGNNPKARNLLRDYFEEIDNKEIVVRIVTNYIPDQKNNYEITKYIEGEYIDSKKAKILPTISFGDDVLQTIDSNNEPFDDVTEGKLTLDLPNNKLVYSQNSFICNIRASSLKDLWDVEGNRGLLAKNLRYYVKSQNIDDKIENSIINDGDNFWYLNNGIIIVCEDYKIEGTTLKLYNFSIVNGGQTTRMIGKIPFTNDFLISCKVVKNTFSTKKEANLFVSKVAEASNTQKPIKAKDIIANRPEQRDLKSLMNENNIYCEIKRGEKCNTKVFVEQWQRTKNNELAQDLYAFVFMEPGPARNNVSKILINADKYDKIFVKHEYDIDFLRSILYIEKAYKQYAKNIKKDSTVNSRKQNFVKYGQFYVLGLLGYILKLTYNDKFKTDMHQYRNNEGEYSRRSSELAFNHSFVAKGTEFKKFIPIATEIFDYIIDNFVMMQITMYDANHANNLSLTNFTKTNTGFNLIRNLINVSLFDNKDNYRLLNKMKEWFGDISSKQEEVNENLYEGYLGEEKEGVPRDSKGNEISDRDKRIRDALLILFNKKALEMHLNPERFVNLNFIDKLVANKPTGLEAFQSLLGKYNQIYLEIADDIIETIDNNL